MAIVSSFCFVLVVIHVRCGYTLYMWLTLNLDHRVHAAVHPWVRSARHRSDVFKTNWEKWNCECPRGDLICTFCGWPSSPPTTTSAEWNPTPSHKMSHGISFFLNGANHKTTVITRIRMNSNPTIVVAARCFDHMHVWDDELELGNSENNENVLSSSPSKMRKLFLDSMKW